MRLLYYLPFIFLLFPAVVQAEEISEGDLRKHIEILASDDFGGRNPGTEGENKTVNYIATQWAVAGLFPGADGNSWYAPVKLIERTPLGQTIAFRYSISGKNKTIKMADKIVLRGSKQSSVLSNAQIVYVGYGSDDVEELKKAVSGKLAFMLLSVRPEAEDFPSYRKRKSSLVQAGAAAVITIIDRKNRWERSARRYRRGSTALDGSSEHAPIEGLISRKAAEKVFRKAGLGRYAWLKNAKASDFRAQEIEVYADISTENRVRAYTSHNVVGKIAGSKRDAGAILFLGHWDHFGTCRTADAADPAKDLICNGAVDNASGISLLIEAAKRLSVTKPDRDIYFLATTAEESGLLGARAFVEKPVLPLDELVAVFNADTVALAPNGKLIAVVGRGETKIDADLEKLAKVEGREIDTSDSANAFIKRQDGYAFLEKGVPAVMITSAFSDSDRLKEYLAGSYHDVTDELNDQLLLGGAVDDANFHVALGRYFSSIETYPAKGSGE